MLIKEEGFIQRTVLWNLKSILSKYHNGTQIYTYYSVVYIVMLIILKDWTLYTRGCATSKWKPSACGQQSDGSEQVHWLRVVSLAVSLHNMYYTLYDTRRREGSSLCTVMMP